MLRLKAMEGKNAIHRFFNGSGVAVMGWLLVR